MAANRDDELSPGEVREVVVSEPEPWRQNLNVQIICPDCQETPPNLVDEASSGDLVCGSCGMVLQSNLVDTRSEWRSFANDDQNGDDPSRVGQANQNGLDDNVLRTEIAFTQRSAIGRDLSRTLAKTNEDKNSKTQMEAFDRITDQCSLHHLSKTIETTSKQLYKSALNSKQFKAKNMDAIIMGCIFIACRQHDQSRSFREMGKHTNVSKKELGRIFKMLEKYFKDTKDLKQGSSVDISGFQNTKATDPQDLCERFGNKLKLPTRVSVMAGQCAALLSNNSGLLSGRSPLSVAAVALYIISYFMGYPQSARDISTTCSVSDGTIKNAWKKIYERRDEIIKEEWIKAGGMLDRLPPA